MEPQIAIIIQFVIKSVIVQSPPLGAVVNRFMFVDFVRFEQQRNQLIARQFIIHRRQFVFHLQSPSGSAVGKVSNHPRVDIFAFPDVNDLLVVVKKIINAGHFGQRFDELRFQTAVQPQQRYFGWIWINIQQKIKEGSCRFSVSQALWG